ncbi:hypothetical protein MRX96_001817 [Rhipicephalus microplus]
MLLCVAIADGESDRKVLIVSKSPVHNHDTILSGELDTTATSATPNDTPELQDPPNENLNMDTSAAQDGVLDENSVDLQQLENENPDEGLDATKDDVPDQDSMELQQPENGIKEHIWPDCRCQACASKKIEVLEQEIGNSQKFILELQKQNAKLEVQLDAAMSRCLTLTTLATPKDCMYYTGLPNVEVFNILLEYFAPRAREMLYWGSDKKRHNDPRGNKKKLQSGQRIFHGVSSAQDRYARARTGQEFPDVRKSS